MVWVEAVAGKTYPKPATPLLMDQKSLLFQPHILVAPAGATIEFRNSDNVQHNIFWPSIGGNRKLTHNMGTWPRGQKRTFEFNVPGEVPLLCNVHPEMSAFIIVTPTPYYAETDAAGHYRIANVSDDSYTVMAWHEGYMTESRAVTVAGNAVADFALGK